MNFSRIRRALLAGVVATAAMTLMAYFVAPLMLGHPMDIAEMLAGLLGGSWMMGLSMHLTNGIVVFPIVYVFGLYNFLLGPPWLRGILWGVALWLMLEVVILPMTGAGVFSSNEGGGKPLMAALIAHLIYGALLGSLAGHIAEPAAP